jgi:hypothetical protein
MIVGHSPGSTVIWESTLYGYSSGWDFTGVDYYTLSRDVYRLWLNSSPSWPPRWAQLFS